MIILIKNLYCRDVSFFSIINHDIFPFFPKHVRKHLSFLTFSLHHVLVFSNTREIYANSRAWPLLLLICTLPVLYHYFYSYNSIVFSVEFNRKIKKLCQLIFLAKSVLKSATRVTPLLPHMVNENGIEGRRKNKTDILYSSPVEWQVLL